MSTVMCLALHAFFFSPFNASPYIPFSSTFLVYIAQFYLHFILYLGLVDLPLDFFCASHICVRAVVIARVFDSMSESCIC